MLSSTKSHTIKQCLETIENNIIQIIRSSRKKRIPTYRSSELESPPSYFKTLAREIRANKIQDDIFTGDNTREFKELSVEMETEINFDSSFLAEMLAIKSLYQLRNQLIEEIKNIDASLDNIRNAARTSAAHKIYDKALHRILHAYNQTPLLPPISSYAQDKDLGIFQISAATLLCGFHSSIDAIKNHIRDTYLITSSPETKSLNLSPTTLCVPTIYIEKIALFKRFLDEMKEFNYSLMRKNRDYQDMRVYLLKICTEKTSTAEEKINMIKHYIVRYQHTLPAEKQNTFQRIYSTIDRLLLQFEGKPNSVISRITTMFTHAHAEPENLAGYTPHLLTTISNILDQTATILFLPSVALGDMLQTSGETAVNQFFRHCTVNLVKKIKPLILACQEEASPEVKEFCMNYLTLLSPTHESKEEKIEIKHEPSHFELKKVLLQMKKAAEHSTSTSEFAKDIQAILAMLPPTISTTLGIAIRDRIQARLDDFLLNEINTASKQDDRLCTEILSALEQFDNINTITFCIENLINILRKPSTSSPFVNGLRKILNLFSIEKPLEKQIIIDVKNYLLRNKETSLTPEESRIFGLCKEQVEKIKTSDLSDLSLFNKNATNGSRHVASVRATA